MRRGVTRGDRPRLSGGPSREGGGQLEANVLHHARSIVACLARVLLCAGGLDLTLAVSLSIHITLNNHHPCGKGHTIGQTFFFKASYVSLLSQSHYSLGNAIPLLILR